MKLVDKIHDGGVWADQGVIAGCSGGLFDNIAEAADILRGGSTGNGEFALDVYPTSIPVSLALTKHGATGDLLSAGAIIKPSFCGRVSVRVMFPPTTAFHCATQRATSPTGKVQNPERVSLRAFA